MAVVHRAFAFAPEPADEERVQVIAGLARTGGWLALSTRAQAALQTVQSSSPERLAPFELESDDFVQGWIAPETITPGRAFLIEVLPRLVPIHTLDNSAQPSLLLLSDRPPFGISASLVKRLLYGIPLDRWFDRAAGMPIGIRPPGGPAGGGWLHGRHVARLARQLRAAAAHKLPPDAATHFAFGRLLQMADAVGPSKWLATSTIW